MISEVLAAKRKKIESSFDNVAKAANEFASVTENLHKISSNVSDMSEKIVTHSEAAVDNIAKRFSDEEWARRSRTSGRSSTRRPRTCRR